MKARGRILCIVACLLLILSGCASIHIAAREGNILEMQNYLAKGADVNAKNSDGATVLLIAAAEGHTELVKLLIDKGADVNTHDKYGQTPLLVAAPIGNIEIVKLLVNKGADINAKGKDGWTPLMAAVTTGGLFEMAKYFVDRGADVNAKNKDGLTALMEAAISGNIEIVKLLVDKGADVNAKNKDGRTALMTASMATYQGGRVEIVKLLIDKGADIHAKTPQGLSALLYAIYYKWPQITNLLLSQGAEVPSGDAFVFAYDPVYISSDGEHYSDTKQLAPGSRKIWVWCRPPQGYETKPITLDLWAERGTVYIVNHKMDKMDSSIWELFLGLGKKGTVWIEKIDIKSYGH